MDYRYFYDCQYYVFDVHTGQSYCKYRECELTDSMCDGCRKRKLPKNEGVKNV